MSLNSCTSPAAGSIWTKRSLMAIGAVLELSGCSICVRNRRSS
ncbi:lipoprotein [Porphyromonas gingivalis]|nr:lipoprotein [Porphyromonas gingivalis]